MDDGQQKRRRLSAAGLGTAKQIAPLDRRRNGLLLDRCGSGEAELADALQQILVKPQFREWHATRSPFLSSVSIAGTPATGREAGRCMECTPRWRLRYTAHRRCIQFCRTYAAVASSPRSCRSRTSVACTPPSRCRPRTQMIVSSSAAVRYGVPSPVSVMVTALCPDRLTLRHPRFAPRLYAAATCLTQSTIDRHRSSESSFNRTAPSVSDLTSRAAHSSRM